MANEWRTVRMPYCVGHWIYFRGVYCQSVDSQLFSRRFSVSRVFIIRVWYYVSVCYYFWFYRLAAGQEILYRISQAKVAQAQQQNTMRRIA